MAISSNRTGAISYIARTVHLITQVILINLVREHDFSNSVTSLYHLYAAKKLYDPGRHDASGRTP